MATQPFTLVQSGPSVASTSPDGSGEDIQDSPTPSDLYAAYQEVISVEEIESLMEMFHHSIYPLYVFVLVKTHSSNSMLVYVLTTLDYHTSTGQRSGVEFVNNTTDLNGQSLF